MEIDISISQLKKTYNSYFSSAEQEYKASNSNSNSKSKSGSNDIHSDEPSYIKLTPNAPKVPITDNCDLTEMNEMNELDETTNEMNEMEGANAENETTLSPNTNTNSILTEGLAINENGNKNKNKKNVFEKDKNNDESLLPLTIPRVPSLHLQPQPDLVSSNNSINKEMSEINDNIINDDKDNANDNGNNIITDNTNEDCTNNNNNNSNIGNEQEMDEKESKNENQDVIEMNEMDDMAPSWAFDTLEEEIEYLRNVNLRLRYELEVSNANTNQATTLSTAFASVSGNSNNNNGNNNSSLQENNDDSKLEIKMANNNDLTHKLNKDKKVSFAMNKAFLHNAKVSPYEFSQRVQSKLPQFLRNEEMKQANNKNGKFLTNMDDTTKKDTIYIPSMVENEIGIIDIKHVDWWDIIDYDSIDCDDDYLKSNLNNTIDGQNSSDQMVFNNGVALDGPFVLVRESDVVDAVACFVAQCVIKMPECRNLSHDQMLKLLDGTFAELREKGPIGKLIQWGQMGYSAYGYGKYAWTLYTNPLVAETVMAALVQAVVFFGIL